MPFFISDNLLCSATQGLQDIAPDGKKDLIARKSCNVMEDLEKCSNAVDASCKDANFRQVWEQSSKLVINHYNTKLVINHYNR